MRRALVRSAVTALTIWSYRPVRFAATIVFLLLGMAAFFALADAGRPSQAPSRYTQTWGKDYSSTTCADFGDVMSPGQRFAAAADMLTAARGQDRATTMPSDALVQQFATGLDTACALPDLQLTEVGAGLYLTERNWFRP